MMSSSSAISRQSSMLAWNQNCEKRKKASECFLPIWWRRAARQVREWLLTELDDQEWFSRNRSCLYSACASPRNRWSWKHHSPTKWNVKLTRVGVDSSATINCDLQSLLQTLIQFWLDDWGQQHFLKFCSRHASSFWMNLFCARSRIVSWNSLFKKYLIKIKADWSFLPNVYWAVSSVARIRKSAVFQIVDHKAAEFVV